MQLGMIGLGRMGANMTTRLHARRTSGRRLRPRSGRGAALGRRRRDRRGVAARAGRQAAAAALVWIMVPAGDPTDSTINALLGLLAARRRRSSTAATRAGPTRKRATRAARTSGVSFVDAGTSGGVWGLENGYCLMVGGDDDAVKRVEPIFLTLAPKDGYAHVGPSGAGHFSKMVHNGIEYGMLAAYGEGFEILEKSEYDYDLHQLASIWRYGSVVRSWLLELLELALENDPDLAKVKGWVDDSGEGRWTVQAAIDENVPAPVITLSLMSRFVSRQPESFSAKVIAALRNRVRRPRHQARMTTSATQTATASRPTRCARASRSTASPDPCNVVFFGATGDLMKRMLMPAMWNLRLQRHPAGELRHRRLLALDSSDDEHFRAEMRKSVDEFSRTGPADGTALERLREAPLVRLGQLRRRRRASHKLREQLEKNDRELGTGGNRLFYLSTPPSVFTLDRRPARQRRPRPARRQDRLVAHHHREAVRHRSRLGARAAGRSLQGLRREAGLPHRPLPGQRAGAGHHGAALRQRHLRADLEPPLRRLACRSRRPRRSASSGAAATTTTPARCAT